MSLIKQVRGRRRLTTPCMAGFVSSYEGLLAVRFLLGLLEGPMFSGIVLYLSEGFYTRRDLSLRYVSSSLYRSTYSWSLTLFRISYFFSAASVSAPLPTAIASYANVAPSLHAAFRRLLWFTCGGNFKDGWDRWEGWMGMDFHFGGCATVITGYFW